VPIFGEDAPLCDVSDHSMIETFRPLAVFREFPKDVTSENNKAKYVLVAR